MAQRASQGPKERRDRRGQQERRASKGMLVDPAPKALGEGQDQQARLVKRALRENGEQPGPEGRPAPRGYLAHQAPRGCRALLVRMGEQALPVQQDHKG